ncbi:hypothetical protein [Porphyromonas somerae]|uniref:hypothetical protein n=1 Tax=Porphyromonas somerae TaxID=322095 RepID=UPI002A7F63DB|nr:hypothetical protein [Porphyromonas somerae]MDY3883814.1 hypothetical protein [Porphyromonas somerae]
MRQLKIERNSSPIIQKMDDIIDYPKWVEYIESNSDCFIWYENTEDGISVAQQLDKFQSGLKRGYFIL